MDNYNYDENDDTIKQQLPENTDIISPSGQLENSMEIHQEQSQTDRMKYLQMPPKQKNPFATASLVSGILAVLGTSTIWFGIIFSVAAIVCSIVSKINTGEFDGKAIAGLVLGIVFLIFTLMLFFMVLTILQNPELLEQLQEMMQEYEQFYNNGNTI